MKIFYFCSVGTNLSLVAANLHLGVIKQADLDCREIANLPYFHCLKRDEIGTPLKIGIDEFGHEVYIFGVKNEKLLLCTALKDWLQILGISNKEYKLVDLTNLETTSLKLANVVSLTFGFKDLGRHLAAKRLKKDISKLNPIIEMVKKESFVCSKPSLSG